MLKIYAILLFSFCTYADEGMWTFDNPPTQKLKEKYQFTPTSQWLEHTRRSSVKFPGGSGSFVSKDGLILTNHHVARGQIQKLSSEKNDFIKNGFFAKSKREELKCPDLELNELIEMTDVTNLIVKAQVNGSTVEEKSLAKKAEIARIEKDSLEKTGLNSVVVDLYSGGEYWLYKYKKYTDIRLVMAPEHQAAFFGGDLDNFTFPRYNLDFTLLRAYENGEPVHPAHYLHWNFNGIKDQALVFVTGHPGSTSRNLTTAQLETQRDISLPISLANLNAQRDALYTYSKKGIEEKRRAQSNIFSIENGIKAYLGFKEGLSDPTVMQKLINEEAIYIKENAQPFEKIKAAENAFKARMNDFYYRSQPQISNIFKLAVLIYRYQTEISKPNGQRLAEFQDSKLESLKTQILSPAPLYNDLEEVLLQTAINIQIRGVGENDPYIKKLLGKHQTSASLAHDLASNTKLYDLNYRKSLLEKDANVLADPLIQFVSKFDDHFRAIRKWYEDSITSVASLEGINIAQIKFKLYGKNRYPDATGTLRLSFGKITGYNEGTTKVPYKTTFNGFFERAESFDFNEPFNLTEKIEESKTKINLNTPFNFITNNDIIGGNSGSPMIDRDGNLIGLIFDGNRYSHVGRYVYTGDDGNARALGVTTAAIALALKDIYHMNYILDEIESSK